ncbi:MAG: hypothetical protein E7321_06015 [Clostridiales bacterium]|nr:hypothetical protein [Clostridiales bacterium]
MPNEQDIEPRVLASWRTRACAAGVCVGTQIFLAGCGVGMPLSLSSAWLSALPSLPFAAWLVARCRRRLVSPVHPGRFSRVWHTLLALALLACSAFAAASLVSFAGATLVEQTNAAWAEIMALSAVALCALSGSIGASRLCFALRYALPALTLLLSLAAVPMRVPVGLFPILGAGAPQLAISALSVLFGAAPALMLMLPPTELVHRDENQGAVPNTGFFLRRVLLGALAGVVLLFIASACTTYESIAESTQWGVRLSMAIGNQSHEGVMQMLLVLAKLMAMLLLSVHMLCAAEQALLGAFPRLAAGRAGLLVLLALLGACLAVMVLFGDAPLLAAAPAIAVPAALLAAFSGRRQHA